jgi:diguanylate cyclase (GGDEF)-like protein/PAS domain S-box-containing protein
MTHEDQTFTPEFRALLDASPDAVLIVDGAGRIAALNRRAELLFAATAERLLDQPVETLVPAGGRQAHDWARSPSAPAARAMSTQSGLMGLRADGSRFPIEVSLIPIDGSSAGLVMAVVHEVAGRLRAESGISSPDRTVGALDAISDAILTTDTDGCIDFLNRAAEELTEWTRDSARGRPLSDVLPLIDEESGASLVSPVMACLRRGAHGGPCDAIFPSRSGQEKRALEVSTTPILDSSGAVTGIAVVARDVTHARLLARQLSHQATHDPLTGLVNRSEFERRLGRALVSAAEDRGAHAVCFLDLDGFKAINDTCGHAAGDELLRQLSDLMRDRMRSRDTLARLGGDEFGMLLEHCGLPRAARVAEELRKAIGDYRFTYGAETYAVTASIGIVPVRAGIRRPSDLFRTADAACYQAKRGGGNRIQVSVPHRRSSAEARDHEWSRRVVSAVEENRFRLHAQPLEPLDHAAHRSPRFELLLRLDGGRAEPLSPHAFLPTARRRGLMPTVDRWVIHEAVRQLSERQRAHPGAEQVTVAINLDDETVAAGEVLALVEGELAGTDVRPEALCFEVGESAAVAHPRASARLLDELRAAGCQTTLEHCGRGMAAFTLLRRLQPDYIKIAGHIVRGLARDPVYRALATALNEVGHVLGLKTIGAQVEGPGALACLRLIGVDYAQGFRIGRPEPLEVALARLG